ncbi:MAG: hypothetical protein K6B68_14045, partial [Eubacterium sp.]|nr:hypothetical protein [Eubacterium sp.]
MYNEYKKRYLCKDVGEVVFSDYKIATASVFLSEVDLKIIDQIKLPEKILPEFLLGDFSADFEDIEDELSEYFGKYLIIGKADFDDDIVVLITEDRDVVKYDKS